MKSVTAWAAYRDGHFLYESIRGTRNEVVLYCKVLFGLNKILTMESLGLEICRVTITKIGGGL